MAVTLPKSAKKGPSLPGKAVAKAAPVAVPSAPTKKPMIGEIVQPKAKAAPAVVAPTAVAPPQLRRPTIPPPAPVEDSFAAMFDAPAEDIPTSGLSLEESMAQGRKGSQMFGAPPQPSIEGPEDDDADENWADDVDYEAEGMEVEGAGLDVFEQDQQAAQAALNIRASKTLAPVEAPEGFESFDNTLEAEAYWNSTFIPYAQLTDEQKRLRLEAADLLIRDRGLRRQMMRALAQDDNPALPEGLELYVKVGPKNGQSLSATTNQGPGQPSPSQSTNASLPVAASSSATIVQTAKGPMKLPPGLQQGAAGLKKPLLPKAGGVAEGTATSPIQGAHNPMLDRCERVAARCNAQRQSHMKGAGPCFDPQCQCMGKCLSFFQRPTEGPIDEPVYEMIDERTGEVVGQVPSTKSAGTGAGVGQGKRTVPGRDVYQGAQQPGNEQGVRSGSDGSVWAQGGQQTGQQGGQSSGRWAEADEAQGGGAQEPMMVDGKVLRDMLTLKMVGTPLDSNYWPASSPAELVITGGAESRRSAIIERLVKFWDAAIINKEGQLRPELDLTSNSYRVVLAAFRLFNAIEDYAGAKASNPALDQEAEKKIALAAKEYLDAHKDVPAGELDGDWTDYEGWCAQYGIQVGEPLPAAAQAQ